jgi:hypothetical protein
MKQIDANDYWPEERRRSRLKGDKMCTRLDGRGKTGVVSRPLMLVLQLNFIAADDDATDYTLFTL